MLMPAAVLIFVVLGALCVDYGSVWVDQRELANAAAAAANDAATRAIDLDHWYRTADLQLLEARAWAVAEASVAAKGLDRLDARVTAVEVDGDRVAVTVSGRAHHLFAKGLPGGPEGQDVSATSEAEARELG
jgi:Flp pilus assembly protein TadG